MMSAKKILSALLVLALVLTLAPISPAKAFGQGSLELGESIVVDMPHENATTPIGSGPSLASGNHEKWIDRIANLPAYGTTFYTWLENNTTATGILADPTKATLRNDTYIYQLTTIEASADFTYSSEAPADAAKAAASNHGNQAFAVVMNYAVAIYSAFHRDHPEVFWLSGQSSYNWSMSYSYDYANGAGTVTYTMRVYFNLKGTSFDLRDSAYRDTAAISAGIAQRDADVAEILSDCPTDGPVYEQLRYLNKTLTETNVYNSSASESISTLPWQCLSALAGEDAAYGPVCEGYAKAFKVLCDELGIPCTLVEGDVRSSKSETPSGHMWNYVQVEGGWYAVDVTWNDPLVSSSGDGILSGHESEDWFLLGSDSLVDTDFTFLDSHPVTNVVTTGGMDFSNGPALEQDAYTPGSNYMDIAPYRSADGYTAPVKEGKVFAGWYLDAAMTKPLGKSTRTGYAYAKFVDEQTLSLKFQLSAGVSAESASTDLRLLTSVESLNLSGIWFEVTFNGKTQNLNCTKVYSQILINGQASGGASRYFGSDADYFAAFILTDVPQTAFDSAFAVTPTWKTQDGTVVGGIQRVFAISDTF